MSYSRNEVSVHTMVPMGIKNWARVNPHMDREDESSFLQVKGTHRRVSLLSRQEKTTAFAQNIQSLQESHNLMSYCVLSKSIFLLLNILNVSWNATICFHLNQYTTIRGIKINTPKENAVGLWSLLLFSFIQVAPFIFGIFFLLKGGVGCMSFLNLNF